MSREQSNVLLLTAAYTRWNETKGGDIKVWLDLLDDNVEFSSLAEGAKPMDFTSFRNSKAGVEDYLRSLLEQMEMVHYTIVEYVVQGDRVVAIGSTAWRNRSTGRIVETPKIDLIRMRNGKIVEFFEMYDTAKALATFDLDGQ